MVKILFDSNLSGHHSEYIYYLVRFLEQERDNECDLFYLIVPDTIKVDFSYIVDLVESTPNIEFEFLSKETVQRLKSLPLPKRSFMELNLLIHYAAKLNAKHVYLLYFNIFQLSLVFKRLPFTISGILFLQFHRMDVNSFKDFLKYVRKALLTKLYSINSSVKSIFILNDIETVEYLNYKFNTGKFRLLVDPIPNHTPEDNFDVYDYYKIDRNLKILLHPGVINPRKGTYEIVKAVDHLPSGYSAVYAILIVGKAEDGFGDELRSEIENINNKDFKVIFDNSFVSNERLKALFLQCSSVLIPYKNPEASSGILGHAASAGKSVITSKAGLIGKIVETIGLGITTSVTPTAIANSITMLDTVVLDYQKISAFVEENNVDNFCKIILEN